MNSYILNVIHSSDAKLNFQHHYSSVTWSFRNHNMVNLTSCWRCVQTFLSASAFSLALLLWLWVCFCCCISSGPSAQCKCLCLSVVSCRVLLGFIAGLLWLFLSPDCRGICSGGSGYGLSTKMRSAISDVGRVDVTTRVRRSGSCEASCSELILLSLVGLSWVHFLLLWWIFM